MGLRTISRIPARAWLGKHPIGKPKQSALSRRQHTHIGALRVAAVQTHAGNPLVDDFA
jgi:hypothetical protein